MITILASNFYIYNSNKKISIFIMKLRLINWGRKRVQL